MKKTWKRLCTGFLALATVVTALPTTPVYAESKQYWTESKERVGIVEKVMNDGSIRYNECIIICRNYGFRLCQTFFLGDIPRSVGNCY